MYRYSQQMRQNTTNLRLWNRILAVALILALAGCVAFGVSWQKAQRQNTRSQQVLLARVRSCCTDAKNLAAQKAQYMSQMILNVMQEYDEVKDNRERFF